MDNLLPQDLPLIEEFNEVVANEWNKKFRWTKTYIDNDDD